MFLGVFDFFFFSWIENLELEDIFKKYAWC